MTFNIDNPPKTQAKAPRIPISPDKDSLGKGHIGALYCKAQVQLFVQSDKLSWQLKLMQIDAMIVYQNIGIVSSQSLLTLSSGALPKHTASQYTNSCSHNGINHTVA